MRRVISFGAIGLALSFAVLSAPRAFGQESTTSTKKTTTIAPDGSTKNPYTVDGRNHPGLFNKKGHIGLLGHGAGIQFRNIRIKSLDAKTQNGK